MEFPRLFRGRVIYTKEELSDEIKRIHGKGMCWLSLYSFTEVINRRPNWNTVVIDKVLVECNHKQLKKLVEIYDKYEIWYIGKDQFYFLIPVNTNNLKDTAFKIKDEILDKCGFNANVNYYVNKMIISPGTLNLQTQRYVINIKKEEVNKRLSTIDKWAIGNRSNKLL